MYFMKVRLNKILSLCLCLIIICSMCLVSIAYAVDDVSDYYDLNSSVETPADCCKIKRTTATVTIMPLEKLDLYAEYNVSSDAEYNLEWSIDGKSYFINDGIGKTAYSTDVEILFLDDTTVKLQIVSADGRVLCEDEIFLKSYRDNDRPFWVNLKSYFLLPLIVFVGVVGGTVGPWIGELINLFE